MPRPKRRRKLFGLGRYNLEAHGEETAAATSEGGGAPESQPEPEAEEVSTAMGTVEGLLPLINALLPEGVAISEAVDLDDLAMRLQVVVETLQGVASEPEAEDEAATPEVFSEAIDEQVPAQLSRVLKSIQSDIKTLQRAGTSNQRLTFEQQADELGRAGLPGRDVVQLKAMGAKHGYDLSLIALAKNNKAVSMSRIARGNASADDNSFGSNGGMPHSKSQELSEHFFGKGAGEHTPDIQNRR